MRRPKSPFGEFSDFGYNGGNVGIFSDEKDWRWRTAKTLIITKMIKPWSISTTVRTPDRLRGFLSVLAQLEGERWDKSTQQSFQIRLIQARLFGAHNNQFYSNLPQADISLIESERPISYRKAADIFSRKNYEDPPMRGRQSFKPLQKFGFASVEDGKVRITEMGRILLAETKDYGDIFLHSLLKWQIPNPLEREFPAKQGYNIKPFVGASFLNKNGVITRNPAPLKETADGRRIGI